VGGDQKGLAFIPASELRARWKRVDSDQSVLLNCSPPRTIALTWSRWRNVARRRYCPSFLSVAGKVDSCRTQHRNYYPHPATRYLRHHRFPISLDFPPSWEENPAKLSTDALPLRKSRMYRPPPLRGRSVFDDKKLPLIDPHQPTCNARANVFRSHAFALMPPIASR